MSKPYFQVLDCKSGVDAVASGTGTATAIPTDAAGNVPDYVRLCAPAGVGYKYRFGTAATPIPAVSTGVKIPDEQEIVVRARGYTHIYLYGASGTVNVAAIENS